MQVKYAKEQFNCMYRYVQYFYENVCDVQVKGFLKSFQYNVWENSSWMLDDGQYYIVLNLTESDISVLLYVYENILFYTVEAQRIMSVCEDVFSSILEKYKVGKKDGV